MDHTDAHVGRVHFPEDQTIQHDSEIVISPESDQLINVHLGFLQISHHYKVNFTIKDKMEQDLTYDPLQNLHVKITDVRPSEDGEGHDLVVQYHTHKEKIMKETLVLSDSNNSITLVLHARVLGKGKGTPALKNGIHCTGIDPEYDSEQSDWQGFD